VENRNFENQDPNRIKLNKKTRIRNRKRNEVRERGGEKVTKNIKRPLGGKWGRFASLESEPGRGTKDGVIKERCGTMFLLLEEGVITSSKLPMTVPPGG